MKLINISRGRRKSGKLKALAGTARKSRSKGPAPRVEAIELPPPPRHLDAFERTAWRRLAELVDPLRICAPSDVLAVEQAAISLGMVYRARNELQRKHKGATTYEVITESGTVVRALPQIETTAKFTKIFAAWIAKFGLSPADRERVASIADESADDPLNEFAVGPHGA